MSDQWYRSKPKGGEPCRSFAPFPVWQGMQYLYCMFEGSGMLEPLDNDRYPNLRWTGLRTVLKQAVERISPSKQ